MGSIQVRGNKLYAKIKNLAGLWERVTTGHDDTPENRRGGGVDVTVQGGVAALIKGERRGLELGDHHQRDETVFSPLADWILLPCRPSLARRVLMEALEAVGALEVRDAFEAGDALEAQGRAPRRPVVQAGGALEVRCHHRGTKLDILGPAAAGPRRHARRPPPRNSAVPAFPAAGPRPILPVSTRVAATR